MSTVAFLKKVLSRSPVALGAIVGLLFLAGCKPDYPNCKKDEHCADKGEVCVEGTCRACRDDAQCKAGFQCKNFACVEIPECGPDKACPAGKVCRAGKCGPQCLGDGDCARGQACVQGVCKQSGCFSDTDCSDGQICRAGKCESRCSVDSDCGAGARCEDGECVTGCDADSDCPSGQLCTGGVCTPRSQIGNAAECSLDKVLFDFKESTLTASAKETLAQNARCLQKMGRKVYLAGHADLRGTEDLNLHLSQDRSDAVRGYLENLGVSGSILVSRGCGFRFPAVDRQDDEAFTANRRVEFRLACAAGPDGKKPAQCTEKPCESTP